ncbi:class I SAM-dependent methyltransferase [Jiella pelagia]|uniref:Methyltransferase domain-containing protein n=1 Tax=Jiella pelagia TaxID=2986949 RepID=A0ABY7C2V2_9HYPH|nr:methyltransferase domain-containing protein [Jiella pelagia]WAP69932.1 methyltransferase domain-containing protein [Jiella pelagia]
MAWKNAKKDVRRAALEKLTPGVENHGDILEFGAFASPTFEPGEGSVFYADRLSTEELKTSVKDADKRDAIVDVNFIVAPDFSTPIGRKFDLVIANHVVEHVPDLLGWLNNVGKILNDGGKVFLTVPHKGYTFDILRQPTLARELIDNYEVKRQQPSLSSIVDAAFFRRDIKFGSDVWSGKAESIIAKAPSLNAADYAANVRKRLAAGDYIDAHCNVFTEESFIEVFGYLEAMHFGDLKLLATAPVIRPYNEFYALFGKL